MKKLLRIALLVLIIGVVAMFSAPFLFTTLGCGSFKTTGQIGDTIGGVTAPISSLVGSILVFLALKSQVVAYTIAQDQVSNQRLEEQRKKEINYISDLYKFFSNSIQMYETKFYKGHRAISKVLSVLADAERKRAHEEKRLYYGVTAELYSILKLGRLLADQLNKSGIEDVDKRHFRDLLKHHYDSFILPYVASHDDRPDCPTCGERHNGIPLTMSNLIHETTALLL